MNRGSAMWSSPPTPGFLRFNEAPIHESGKSPRGFSATNTAATASMRPRFMNRGSWELEGPENRNSGTASMRPRFMNRGSHPEEWAHNMIQEASMRPRFMNRGSSRRPRPLHRAPRRFNEAPIHESGKWRGADRKDPTVRASMRPRFMNRGSTGEIMSSSERTRCFNEAPIHESGKFGCDPRGPSAAILLQ